MAAIYKTHRISKGVKPSVKRLTKNPKKNEIIHCNIVVYTLKPSNNWTQEQLDSFVESNTKYKTHKEMLTDAFAESAKKVLLKGFK